MVTRVFTVSQIAKRVDTGEQVQVIEVLPVGLRVFYRIEYKNGDRSLVHDAILREVSRATA